MWLDAIVTAADLQALVDQLIPTTIPLGERGHLFFDTPVDVSLVADRGLRLRCHAKLAWPVLGIDVAVTIRSMTLLVIPSIESRDGEQVVVFSPEVDALDLALVPDIGDAELRAFINRALQEKRIELPWNYRETLGHQFPLPDWFGPGAAFGIRANGAAVKVTNASMGLAIGIHASFETRQTEEHGAINGIIEGAPHQGVGASVAEGYPPSKGNVDPDATDDGVDEDGLAEPWRSPDAQRKTGALAIPRKGARLVGLSVAVLGGFGLGYLVGLWGTNRA